MCALVTGVVTAALLGFQLVHFGPLLRQTSAAEALACLGDGALLLAEVVLPLVACFGCALAFGRWRAEGALVATFALGRSPLVFTAPVLATGLACGLLAFVIAAEEAPAAARRLRERLVAAALVSPLRAGHSVPLAGSMAMAARLPMHELWAVWSLPAGAVFLRAGSVEALSLDAAVLRDVRLWGPDLHAQVGRAELKLEGTSLRSLGPLAAPNDLPSRLLSLSDLRQAFVFSRRWALPASAPLWAVLGAALGAALGVFPAIIAGALSAFGFYALLRSLELLMRAGRVSPEAAAVTPLVVLAVLTLAVLISCRPRWSRLPRSMTG